MIQWNQFRAWEDGVQQSRPYRCWLLGVLVTEEQRLVLHLFLDDESSDHFVTNAPPELTQDLLKRDGSLVTFRRTNEGQWAVG